MAVTNWVLESPKSSIKDFVAHVLNMTARKQNISGYL